MERTVLFIGGTGTISWSCATEAIAAGWKVSVLNRGNFAKRPLPEGAELITADLDDDAALTNAVGGREFDVVADFMSFTTDRLERNMKLFEGKMGQYVFISSASAYAKPVARLPITESTPLANPFWQYSRDKIACENLLVEAFRDRGFPATIVRPSHTYDAGLLPNHGEWTDIVRMRAGKPIVVLGDGTSLWTLTHASDFAQWYVPLLGERRAIGDVFQITSDEAIPWDAIYRELASAAGVSDPQFVHVASETIAQELPDWGPGLLGDKAHSVVFDNSKVRSLAPGAAQKVPFSVGAKQIIEFHDAHPEFAVFNDEVDAAYDRLIARVTG
ncbi:MAG: NAD-dependent epimerase/dehydratase family protein [Propionibacteriaceae bacterium]|nr:NAD-dependent epimerase/dehydratase family protein [Propionibacteriaceae bacterium]